MEGKVPRKGTRIRYRCRDPLIHTLKTPLQTENLKPLYICKVPIDLKVNK